jgi:phosphoenolpyruvate carboxykinase (ATP)
LALPPEVYAKLFREKIREYKPTCWLVNTGWTGGPFGVGHRMEIAHSRALLNAAMSGKLDDVPTYQDPYFGLTVPTTCPGVPDSILYPQKTWADPKAYETTARDLAGRFRKNFTKYAANVEPEVLAAEPK